jgi:hypothetical protein
MQAALAGKDQTPDNPADRFGLAYGHRSEDIRGPL